VKIKDSFRNKHCRISLHDVGGNGKLVQTLDSGVGWGWGRGNLHGNGDGDGEFFCGDGENFMGTGWGWGQFYGDGDNFIFHSLHVTTSVLLTMHDTNMSATTISLVFTAQRSLVQSAVLGSHVVHTSVCPSIHL